ncbi:unnamed protein product [Meloidogyne enterolobii]|uniref:Uncharacterized protein n=1 Tax=Meloidogyne enterolobii TaxID=390850 RepID=A0ACB0Z078_MELEN
MLFCLLHPMDHNTGPLARKSTTTLCALLLVSIAALLVLAVPGQANVTEVGVANHTKNGSSVTLKGVSKQAGEDLTYAEYVKRFPTVCNFKINKDYIELLYEGTGCTVELITEKKMNMINLTTGVYLKKDCELDKCSDPDAVRSFKDGFSNLLPFAYGRNNKDLKNLSASPSYDKKAKCGAKDLCGGECMKETFLEVSWSQCLGFVYAHTHLIGEFVTGLEHMFETKGGDKKEFRLEIYDDSSFKMETPLFKTNEILCATTKGIAIVRPETWKIIKGDLKDKYLLVFHLLPQTATRHFEGRQFVKEPPSRVKPNCDLFIHFDRPAYEFLQVDPRTTTTSTTTTPKLGTTSPSKNKTASTPRSQQGNTTNVQTEEGSNAWIWIFVIFVVIAVICLGVVGFHFFKEYKKIKDEDEKERIWWANVGDEAEIADQNMKRSVAEVPSLEYDFVNDIYQRMRREDLGNAEMYKKMLFKLYLPLLEEKGFKTIGTFREWRKKNKLFHERGETLDEFNIKVSVAMGKMLKKQNNEGFFLIKRSDEKTKDDKVKKDKTPKDPAPKKTDAAKSKQADTTSNIPTE